MIYAVLDCIRNQHVTGNDYLGGYKNVGYGTSAFTRKAVLFRLPLNLYVHILFNINVGVLYICN